MKVIITENQHRLLRRVSEIEHIIAPTMDLAYEYLQGDDPSPLSFFFYDTFIGFITLKIANTIDNNVVDEIKIIVNQQQDISDKLKVLVNSDQSIRQGEYLDITKDIANQTELKKLMGDNPQNFI